MPRVTPTVGSALADRTAASASTVHRTRHVEWMAVCAVCLLSCGATTLLGHVDVIVRDSTKKQVVRSYTRPIVAAMKNPQGIRDKAVRELPRQAMRINEDATSADLVRHQLTVADAVERCGPQPAIRFHAGDAMTGILVYLLPEAISDRPDRSMPTDIAAGGESTAPAATRTEARPHRSIINRLDGISMPVQVRR